MVVVSILTHAEFGPNVDREDAPHFTYSAQGGVGGIELNCSFDMITPCSQIKINSNVFPITNKSNTKK